MPRPKSKADLLNLSKKLFDELLIKCDQWEQEQGVEFSTPTMNRNPRDVLAHIHAWQLMYLDWHTIGMSGVQPDMPAKGYTWSQSPALNKKIWEGCQELELQEVKEFLKESHWQILELAQSMSEEELFERKRYPWTGTTFVAQYMISALSSHYDWGIKMIKKAERALATA